MYLSLILFMYLSPAPCTTLHTVVSVYPCSERVPGCVLRCPSGGLGPGCGSAGGLLCSVDAVRCNLFEEAPALRPGT